MADEIFTKQVQTMFSLYGLTITKNLSGYVARQISRGIPESERDKFLTGIIEQLLTQTLKTPNVQKEHIILAFNDYVRPTTSLKDTETIINIINAFDTPKVQYDLGRRKFMIKTVDKDLYPDAEHKSLVFKDRLDLLYYRTLRHDHFKSSKFGESNEGKLELVAIENLLSEAKTENVYVIGLLSQLTEGEFYLEDSYGSVKLDLRKADFQTSLIMEGSIVIASGNYSDSVFEVEKIGFPPSEPSENSRVAFGTVNTFGGANPISLKLSEKLHEQEILQKDMLIFISDFWVDDIRVLEKFKEILNGFSDSPPVAFVLFGNFLSFPPDATSAQKLKDGFKSLADLITQHHAILETSHFILVPGPFDLGAPRILPRAPLPKSVVADFIKRVPHTHLATNPCRIQYCTKEIVVFREDILLKLCRNTLKFLNTGNVYEHYAKSIVCQSHLVPLTLQATPIYWKYDHALQLFPTPDLIVVADSFSSYKTEFSKCHVINPGSFLRSGFSFQAYNPAELLEDQITDCQINE
ncbi:DNA polymerase epsilon subunit 2 [Leptopilina heterotoma]|uniref:DNA polymerase epsilon subunit 2 n=1 Tax=Leptopilina heterotoma TaxID=63436 RepID=UPI001CA843E6|nr:DNA polymerase epsilon subunit 2 [Leptopilina heterotoma]XP_043477042.1 DNA polymerase epsilon subunit 2 [Leptopilina heterotoma]